VRPVCIVAPFAPGGTAGTPGRSRQFINTLTWERVEAFPLTTPQET